MPEQEARRVKNPRSLHCCKGNGGANGKQSPKTERLTCVNSPALAPSSYLLNWPVGRVRRRNRNQKPVVLGWMGPEVALRCLRPAVCEFGAGSTQLRTLLRYESKGDLSGDWLLAGDRLTCESLRNSVLDKPQLTWISGQMGHRSKGQRPESTLKCVRPVFGKTGVNSLRAPNCKESKQLGSQTPRVPRHSLGDRCWRA